MSSTSINIKPAKSAIPARAGELEWLISSAASFSIVMRYMRSIETAFDFAIRYLFCSLLPLLPPISRLLHYTARLLGRFLLSESDRKLIDVLVLCGRSQATFSADRLDTRAHAFAGDRANHGNLCIYVGLERDAVAPDVYLRALVQCMAKLNESQPVLEQTAETLGRLYYEHSARLEKQFEAQKQAQEKEPQPSTSVATVAPSLAAHERGAARGSSRCSARGAAAADAKVTQNGSAAAPAAAAAAAPFVLLQSKAPKGKAAAAKEAAAKEAKEKAAPLHAIPEETAIPAGPAVAGKKHEADSALVDKRPTKQAKQPVLKLTALAPRRPVATGVPPRDPLPIVDHDSKKPIVVICCDCEGTGKCSGCDGQGCDECDESGACPKCKKGLKQLGQWHCISCEDDVSNTAKEADFNETERLCLDCFEWHNQLCYRCQNPASLASLKTAAFGFLMCRACSD